MTWNPRTTLLVGTILLPIFAATGCTGTDVITPGNGMVRFEPVITNVVNGSRFEGLFVTLNQVTLRPVEPAANTVVGSLDLALVSTARTINLAGDIVGSPNVPIPAGDYRIESLQFVSIQALDTDGTGSPASCAEYIANFPATGTITWQDGAELDVVVTIDPNAVNVIQLSIDVDEFVKALASAWRCTSFGCPPGEAWCLGSNFLQARFKLFTDQYFSFD